MAWLSTLLVLCCNAVLNSAPVGYTVYWAVPKVTVVSHGDPVIACPPYPKGYVLLGTFRRDADIRQQMEEEEEPACYHYVPLMPGETS